MEKKSWSWSLMTATEQYIRNSICFVVAILFLTEFNEVEKNVILDHFLKQVIYYGMSRDQMKV